jgi:succinate dehydrogenase / fumarate reductase, cytochrome b subunit
MDWVLAFYRSTIGKKVVMATTGVILFGYVVGHMLGNLQIFAGEAQINGYAAFLHRTKPLLWGTRGLLVLCVILHFLSAAQLWLLQRAARPIGYQNRTWVEAGYAARTMIWTGPLLAIFVVFHLMHLTWGVKSIDAQFVEGEVFGNVVRGFQSKGIAIFYLCCLCGLAFHLLHGAWSMFQTIGIDHPRYNRVLRELAKVATVVVAGGFALVPVAVLLGIVRLR